MWTDTTRAQYARADLALPSDLTDTEWALLEPFFPAPSDTGRPRKWPMRRVVEAILYDGAARYRANARRQGFFRDNPFFYDGRAVERIVDIICDESPSVAANDSERLEHGTVELGTGGDVQPGNPTEHELHKKRRKPGPRSKRGTHVRR